MTRLSDISHPSDERVYFSIILPENPSIRRLAYWEPLPLTSLQLDLFCDNDCDDSDLMAVLPYPTAPPKNPAKLEKKPDPPKPDSQKPGGGKPPGGFPAWASYAPPQIPVIGGPARPLPQPQSIAAPAAPAPSPAPQQYMNMSGGIVPPPPPPAGTRPMPQV
ncbi:hypothetical protein BCR39DRAFT_560455 [Naematelia encephala]|uniref:Uncharacterized protein n=1 Tax=Naematelia encephala TaxID=71784 RepID=A0A1Y2AW99_9TREE|nr:hypothetical protein BCR39DRAFT_560455 [Naematelia encephala]